MSTQYYVGTVYIRLVPTGTQKLRDQDKIKTLEGLLARIHIICIDAQEINHVSE